MGIDKPDVRKIIHYGGMFNLNFANKIVVSLKYVLLLIKDTAKKVYNNSYLVWCYFKFLESNVGTVS